MQPIPPCSAPAGWWQMPAFGLLLHWELHLGTHSVDFLFSLPVLVPSEIPKLPTDLLMSFPVFGNFSSFTTPSPGRVSVLNSLVSLFVFYILPYLLLKRVGCLSGCLVSSVSIQKLFCGICSALKCSFEEFVRETVISPSYSSAIFLSDPKNIC